SGGQVARRDGTPLLAGGGAGGGLLMSALTLAYPCGGRNSSTAAKTRSSAGVAYSQGLLHNYPHDLPPQRRRARRLGLRRGRAAAPPGPPPRPRRRLGRRGLLGRPPAPLPPPRAPRRLRRARLLLGRRGPGEGRRRALL